MKKKLHALNIPDGAIALEGGLPNEAFCIEEKGGVWETYYSERGQKSSKKAFNNEEEAYEYFYQWMEKKFSR